LAGLTIDGFTAATVPLSDGNLVGVGQGAMPTQTYKADILEFYKYNQRKLSVTSNSMVGGNAVLINGVLTPSSASNNLTISLKTLAGNDPSSTDPVFVIFRSFSIVDGGYAIRSIIGATSFTVNTPNTLGISAGAAEVFIVGIDDTGPTFRLGLVNPKISASQVYVPDEWALKSATTGNGGNSAGTIYANATVTNRPIVNLGFMRWSNFATPGTWTLPTSIQTITSSALDGRLQEAVNDYLTRLAAKADIASPTFTGIPGAPTPASLVNTTQIPTTAYLVTYYAPLNSPTFTGTVTAPTAVADTSSTVVATTAYFMGQAAGSAPLIDGTATVGTATRWARQDHVHPTDTTRAPLASPTFTGVPAGPTAAVGTNTTQFATCAFTLANAGSVTYSATNPLVNGTAAPGTATTVARSDHVHPTDTSRAPTASPTFSGTITLPASNWTIALSSALATITYDTGDSNYYDRTNNVFYWAIGSATKLSLNSSGQLTATGDVTGNSDPRLKDNITPIDNARSIINRLQGYRFIWNETAQEIGRDREQDVGLLSTEVKTVLPEAVKDGPPNSTGVIYDTVAYHKIIPILVSGFNQLDSQVQQLEDELSTVLARLAVLEGK
jgi:hypothetical protein